MTEGRDGISLAHAVALKFTGIARQLSAVAAVFVIAALVTGTAGTSYAGPKKGKVAASGGGSGLRDTVAVSNFGGLFDASLETFLQGSGSHAKPASQIKGPNSFLDIGAGEDAVSSLDAHVAVALPADFLGLTAPLGNYVGCGPFGVPAAHPLYGTGLVEIFSPTATGDSAAENEICSPGFALGYPNTTGIFFPQGVAFEDPWDGVNRPEQEILAVANLFPEVTQDAAECVALGLPPATLGTITEYDRSAFTPGLNNVQPFNNNPVSAINPFTTLSYTQNTTIGGCFTALAGPIALAFDQNGYLIAVNNAGALEAALQALPRFITVYGPGQSGDVFPTALIGYPPTTATGGTLIQPIAVTVSTLGYEDDVMFVTDLGDKTHPPAIKIFDVFVNFDSSVLAYTGSLIGEIAGGNTKLKSPKGIALNVAGDTLYVASNTTNSLLMFTDFVTDGPQNLPPTLIISGNRANMNFPVGVALPAFAPTSLPEGGATPAASIAHQ